MHPRLGVGFSPGDEAANRAFGLWDTETFDSNGLDRTSESRGAATVKVITTESVLGPSWGAVLQV